MTEAIPPEKKVQPADQEGAVLITGAAGFLGRHLCEFFLKERGCKVIGWDNFSSGQPKNFDDLRALYPTKFIGERLDVCDRLAVLEHEANCPIKYVLHFACLASPKWYQADPVGTLRVGSFGAWNMLQLAKRKGARVLLASTSEVYGDPDKDHHPQREDYWGDVNPVGVRSMYDESKRFQEALAMSFREQNPGMIIRIARIFNTYGPHMRPDDQRVVSDFIMAGLRGKPMKIFGDGSQTRSLCYVSDLVAGLVALLEHNEPNEPLNLSALNREEFEEVARTDVRLPVNLGNDKGLVKVIELAEKVRKLTGSKVKHDSRPMPGDDPQQRCPNLTKAKTLLGWEPVVELDEGLELTYKHYRELVKD